MDRDEFLRGLEAYHLERGHAFTPGRLLGQKVDLYEMFVTAMRQGGFPRINKNNKWGFLAKHLRLVPKDKPPSAQDLEQVKRYYVKWIRHFEGEKVPQHVKKHLIPPGMELPCRRSASSSSSSAAAATAAANAGTTPFHPRGGVGVGYPGGAAGGLGVLPSVFTGGNFVPGPGGGFTQSSRGAGMYNISPSMLMGAAGNKAGVPGYMTGSTNAAFIGSSQAHSSSAFFPPGFVFPCSGGAGGNSVVGHLLPPSSTPPGFAAVAAAAGLATVASGGGGGVVGGGGISGANSSNMMLRPSAACTFDPTAAFAAAAAVNALGAPMSSSHMSAAGKTAGFPAHAAVFPPGADEFLLANCFPAARTRNERRFLQQQQHIITAPGAANALLPPAGVSLSIPLPFSPPVSATAQPGVTGEANRRRHRLFMRYTLEAIAEKRRKRRRREAFVKEGRLPPAVDVQRLQQCLEERCLAPADAVFALNLLYYLSLPARHCLSVEMHPGLVDQLSAILAEAAVRARVGLLQLLQEDPPFSTLSISSSGAAVSSVVMGESDTERQRQEKEDIACVGCGVSSSEDDFSYQHPPSGDEGSGTDAAVVDWPTFFGAIYDTRGSPAAARVNGLHQPVDPAALLSSLLPYDWSSSSSRSSMYCNSNVRSSANNDSTSCCSSTSSSRKQSSSKRSSTSHIISFSEDDTNGIVGAGAAATAATATSVPGAAATGSQSRRTESKSRNSSSSSRACNSNSYGNGTGGCSSSIRACSSSSSCNSSLYQPYLWASSPGAALLLQSETEEVATLAPRETAAGEEALRVQTDLQVVQLVCAILCNIFFDPANTLYFSSISRRELRDAASAVQSFSISAAAAGAGAGGAGALEQGMHFPERDEEEDGNAMWRETAAGGRVTATERRQQQVMQQQQEKKVGGPGAANHADARTTAGAIVKGDSSVEAAAAVVAACVLEETADEDFYTRKPPYLLHHEGVAEDAEKEARDESDVEAAELEEELLVGMAEKAEVAFTRQGKMFRRLPSSSCDTSSSSSSSNNNNNSNREGLLQLSAAVGGGGAGGGYSMAGGGSGGSSGVSCSNGSSSTSSSSSSTSTSSSSTATGGGSSSSSILLTATGGGSSSNTFPLNTGAAGAAAEQQRRIEAERRGRTVKAAAAALLSALDCFGVAAVRAERRLAIAATHATAMVLYSNCYEDVYTSSSSSSTKDVDEVLPDTSSATSNIGPRSPFAVAAAAMKKKPLLRRQPQTSRARTNSANTPHNHSEGKKSMHLQQQQHSDTQKKTQQRSKQEEQEQSDMITVNTSERKEEKHVNLSEEQQPHSQSPSHAHSDVNGQLPLSTNYDETSKQQQQIDPQQSQQQQQGEQQQQQQQGEQQQQQGRSYQQQEQGGQEQKQQGDGQQEEQGEQQQVQKQQQQHEEHQEQGKRLQHVVEQRDQEQQQQQQDNEERSASALVVEGEQRTKERQTEQRQQQQQMGKRKSVSVADDTSQQGKKQQQHQQHQHEQQQDCKECPVLAAAVAGDVLQLLSLFIGEEQQLLLEEEEEEEERRCNISSSHRSAADVASAEALSLLTGYTTACRIRALRHLQQQAAAALPPSVAATATTGATGCPLEPASAGAAAAGAAAAGAGAAGAGPAEMNSEGQYTEGTELLQQQQQQHQDTQPGRDEEESERSSSVALSLEQEGDVRQTESTNTKENEGTTAAAAGAVQQALPHAVKSERDDNVSTLSNEEEKLHPADKQEKQAFTCIQAERAIYRGLAAHEPSPVETFLFGGAAKIGYESSYPQHQGEKKEQQQQPHEVLIKQLYDETCATETYQQTTGFPLHHRQDRNSSNSIVVGGLRSAAAGASAAARDSSTAARAAILRDPCFKGWTSFCSGKQYTREGAARDETAGEARDITGSSNSNSSSSRSKSALLHREKETASILNTSKRGRVSSSCSSGGLTGGAEEGDITSSFSPPLDGVARTSSISMLPKKKLLLAWLGAEDEEFTLQQSPGNSSVGQQLLQQQRDREVSYQHGRARNNTSHHKQQFSADAFFSAASPQSLSSQRHSYHKKMGGTGGGGASSPARGSSTSSNRSNAGGGTGRLTSSNNTRTGGGGGGGGRGSNRKSSAVIQHATSSAGNININHVQDEKYKEKGKLHADFLRMILQAVQKASQQLSREEQLRRYERVRDIFMTVVSPLLLLPHSPHRGALQVMLALQLIILINPAQLAEPLEPLYVAAAAAAEASNVWQGGAQILLHKKHQQLIIARAAAALPAASFSRAAGNKRDAAGAAAEEYVAAELKDGGSSNTSTAPALKQTECIVDATPRDDNIRNLSVGESPHSAAAMDSREEQQTSNSSNSRAGSSSSNITNKVEELKEKEESMNHEEEEREKMGKDLSTEEQQKGSRSASVSRQHNACSSSSNSRGSSIQRQGGSRSNSVSRQSSSNVLKESKSSSQGLPETPGTATAPVNRGHGRSNSSACKRYGAAAAAASASSSSSGGGSYISTPEDTSLTRQYCRRQQQQRFLDGAVAAAADTQKKLLCTMKKEMEYLTPHMEAAVACIKAFTAIVCLLPRPPSPHVFCGVAGCVRYQREQQHGQQQQQRQQHHQGCYLNAPQTSWLATSFAGAVARLFTGLQQISGATIPRVLQCATGLHLLQAVCEFGAQMLLFKQTAMYVHLEVFLSIAAAVLQLDHLPTLQIPPVLTRASLSVMYMAADAPAAALVEVLEAIAARHQRQAPTAAVNIEEEEGTLFRGGEEMTHGENSCMQWSSISSNNKPSVPTRRIYTGVTERAATNAATASTAQTAAAAAAAAERGKATHSRKNKQAAEGNAVEEKSTSPTEDIQMQKEEQQQEIQSMVEQQVKGATGTVSEKQQQQDSRLHGRHDTKEDDLLTRDSCMPSSNGVKCERISPGAIEVAALLFLGPLLRFLKFRLVRAVRLQSECEMADPLAAYAAFFEAEASRLLLSPLCSSPYATVIPHYLVSKQHSSGSSKTESNTVVVGEKSRGGWMYAAYIGAIQQPPQDVRLWGPAAGSHSSNTAAAVSHNTSGAVNAVASSCTAEKNCAAMMPPTAIGGNSNSAGAPATALNEPHTYGTPPAAAQSSHDTWPAGPAASAPGTRTSHSTYSSNEVIVTASGVSTPESAVVATGNADGRASSLSVAADSELQENHPTTPGGGRKRLCLPYHHTYTEEGISSSSSSHVSNSNTNSIHSSTNGSSNSSGTISSSHNDSEGFLKSKQVRADGEASKEATMRVSGGTEGDCGMAVPACEIHLQHQDGRRTGWKQHEGESLTAGVNRSLSPAAGAALLPVVDMHQSANSPSQQQHLQHQEGEGQSQQDTNSTARGTHLAAACVFPPSPYFDEAHARYHCSSPQRVQQQHPQQLQQQGKAAAMVNGINHTREGRVVELPIVCSRENQEACSFNSSNSSNMAMADVSRLECRGSSGTYAAVPGVIPQQLEQHQRVILALERQQQQQHMPQQQLQHMSQQQLQHMSQQQQQQHMPQSPHQQQHMSQQQQQHCHQEPLQREQHLPHSMQEQQQQQQHPQRLQSYIRELKDKPTAHSSARMGSSSSGAAAAEMSEGNSITSDHSISMQQHTTSLAVGTSNENAALGSALHASVIGGTGEECVAVAAAQRKQQMTPCAIRECRAAAAGENADSSATPPQHLSERYSADIEQPAAPIRRFEQQEDHAAAAPTAPPSPGMSPQRQRQQQHETANRGSTGPASRQQESMHMNTSSAATAAQQEPQEQQGQQLALQEQRSSTTTSSTQQQPLYQQGGPQQQNWQPQQQLTWQQQQHHRLQWNGSQPSHEQQQQMWGQQSQQFYCSPNNWQVQQQPSATPSPQVMVNTGRPVTATGGALQQQQDPTLQQQQWLPPQQHSTSSQQQWAGLPQALQQQHRPPASQQQQQHWRGPLQQQLPQQQPPQQQPPQQQPPQQQYYPTQQASQQWQQQQQQPTWQQQPAPQATGQQAYPSPHQHPNAPPAAHPSPQQSMQQIQQQQPWPQPQQSALPLQQAQQQAWQQQQQHRLPTPQQSMSSSLEHKRSQARCVKPVASADGDIPVDFAAGTPLQSEESSSSCAQSPHGGATVACVSGTSSNGGHLTPSQQLQHLQQFQQPQYPQPQSFQQPFQPQQQVQQLQSRHQQLQQHAQQQQQLQQQQHSWRGHPPGPGLHVTPPMGPRAQQLQQQMLHASAGERRQSTWAGGMQRQREYAASPPQQQHHQGWWNATAANSTSNTSTPTSMQIVPPTSTSNFNKRRQQQSTIGGRGGAAATYGSIPLRKEDRRLHRDAAGAAAAFGDVEAVADDDVRVAVSVLVRLASDSSTLPLLRPHLPLLTELAWYRTSVRRSLFAVVQELLLDVGGEVTHAEKTKRVVEESGDASMSAKRGVKGESEGDGTGAGELKLQMYANQDTQQGKAEEPRDEQKPPAAEEKRDRSPTTRAPGHARQANEGERQKGDVIAEELIKRRKNLLPHFGLLGSSRELLCVRKVAAGGKQLSVPAAVELRLC